MLFDRLIPVAGTRLTARVSFYPAATAISPWVVVLSHGICHSRVHFERLIAALNGQGLDAAFIDLQSESAGWFRNWIGLGHYARAMSAAVRELFAFPELQDRQRGVYVFHSMGALIGEQMQELDMMLQSPTVLLAPVPPRGALGTTCRIFLRFPGAYLWAVVTLNIRSLGRSRDRVSWLFFDAETPAELVDQTCETLKHASFLAYCQLTFRRWFGFSTREHGRKQLLITSRTDRIFTPGDYREIGQIYQKLQTLEFPTGGHDFFMQFAAATAAAIADFQQQVCVLPVRQGKTLSRNKVSLRFDQAEPLSAPRGQSSSGQHAETGRDALRTGHDSEPGQTSGDADNDRARQV